MADTKVSALTAIDAVAHPDLVYVVDDPSGTPTGKKATAQQLLCDPFGPLAGFRNHLMNGAMMVAQRGVSFTSGANNDDVYTLDRWNLLSDGNNIVDIGQNTGAPTNGLYSLNATVVTVNKKFGVLQVIEQKNCIGLIGNTVTLSAYLTVSNATRLDKIKVAIVSWSGTADSVTSDIVSAWNADGTDPTLVANWTYENAPSDLGVTTSWARYSVTAAIDTASTKNIAVFIWSDNVTDTDVGDVLYVTDVQLEIGSEATPFERRPISSELMNCQRYFQKSFVQDTAPAQNIGVNLGGIEIGSLVAGATLMRWPANVFAVLMRAAPTVTFYNPAAANAQVRDRSASADFSSTSVGMAAPWGFRVTTTGNAATVAQNLLEVHWTADAEL